MRSDDSTLPDVRERVGAKLSAFVTARAGELGGLSPDLSPLMSALSDLSSTGKRLRATFCYWGWRGAPKHNPAYDDLVIAASVAVELLQSSALLHDDVMDGSDTRRGAPAAHRRFEALHRDAGWAGSPERFGEGAAILLGDMCLSWTDQAFLESGLPSESLLRAKPVLDTMRTEVMAGQYLDLIAQARGTTSAEEVMRVVRYKAAKYTVERPLHLGAALAGADASLISAYTDFGLPVGEAFQLRDDILGVFGDPARTGKPAGDDLREGKRTLLVVLALQHSTAAQAARLQELLGDSEMSEAHLEELRDILIAAGALTAVEGRIEALTEQARAALARADIEPEARDVLDALAVSLTTRSA